MLTQIGIDYQNNEACVEELAQECPFNNRGLLLTDSVLSDPAHEYDHYFLKDGIYNDNNQCNRECKNLREKLIILVLKTNLLLKYNFSIFFKLVRLSFLVLKFLFLVTEALHWSGIKCDATLLLDSCVNHVFINGIANPSLSPVVVLFNIWPTWHLWILLFHSHSKLLCSENGVEGAYKDTNDSQDDDVGSEESLGCSEMSVFPNNIRWFTSLCHVNDFTKECPVMSKIFLLYSFIIQFASTFTFFRFKGKEAVTWCLHLIKQLLGVV